MDWYALADTRELISPSLLVYPERIRANIERMVATAGSPNTMWPHVKTHKTDEIIAMQLAAGIHRFKCATLAEGELLGRCGVRKALLAMQPVGPNVERFFRLQTAYPYTQFSTLVDNAHSLASLTAAAERRGVRIRLWLDVNVGMDRTGAVPDAATEQLYATMAAAPSVLPQGLHAYDGHVHQRDVGERNTSAKRAFERVLSLKRHLLERGLGVPLILAGGSPSFPVHAREAGVHTSPGTTLLWDAGYGELFADMGYLPAAALVTRIVSKPAPQLLCTDLGHKSVASEMPLPRVRFLGDHTFEQLSQSEEHLVLRSERAERYRVGDPLYALPVHICPTVAKFPALKVVEDGRISTEWRVTARDQKITI